MNYRLQKILIWPIFLVLIIGIITSGISDVICIDNNCLVKFEVLCLPCCGEDGHSCDTEFPDEQKKELADCSVCSDIELDVPFLSKRIQRSDSNEKNKFVSELLPSLYLSVPSSKDNDSQIIKFYLAIGQSPPALSISTIVSRC